MILTTSIYDTLSRLYMEKAYFQNLFYIASWKATLANRDRQIFYVCWLNSPAS